MKALSALFRALRAGEELANADTWKNRQNAANAILALLGALLALAQSFGINLDIPPSDLAVVASGIAIVGGLLNAYLTTSTSARIGLPPVNQPDPPGNTPGDTNIMDSGG